MSRRINFLFIFIFLVYAVARITFNIASINKPRELADTVAYLRISQEPLLTVDFWGDARPFVFPLLLKISRQDVSLASAIQLVFSILAWGLFAFFLSASIRTLWLRPVSSGILLALSLVRHLASWDYVMMTESLSVSWFVLFLAIGIWLSQEWRAYKIFILGITGLFFAFTRDTNAYLLVMLAGLLLISILFRWIKPRAMILVVFFLFIFYINNLTSEIGARWVFPLNNIIGRRVLPNAQSVDEFKACGMPVNAELLELANTYANGQDRAFYEDPALEDYRVWLGEQGKSCYMKWLLSKPMGSINDPLAEFQNLIVFDKLDNFFARKYDPVIPYFLEPFLYPVKFIVPLWLILTLIALIAIWKKAWIGRHLWGVYILLCLPILPHLFITWHGDAMAPERHALSVGLQLALSFWLALFLLIDQFNSRYKTD